MRGLESTILFSDATAGAHAVFAALAAMCGYRQRIISVFSFFSPRSREPLENGTEPADGSTIDRVRNEGSLPGPGM